MNAKDPTLSIRDPVQGLWIGSRLSPLERLSIVSFLQNGHPYVLYTYGEVEGVPAGTEVRDGREILPEDEIFTYRNGSCAAGSNLFRFELLAQRGGIWVDTDVVCLRPFDFPEELLFFAEPSACGPETGTETEMATCVLKAPAGHPAMRWAAEACRQARPDVLAGRIEWDLGPSTVERMIARFGLASHVKPWQSICLGSWSDWQALIGSGPAPVHPLPRHLDLVPAETFAVHLWHQMWRANGCDKDGVFPADCLFEQLKRRYGVAPSQGSRT